MSRYAATETFTGNWGMSHFESYSEVGSVTNRAFSVTAERLFHPEDGHCRAKGIRRAAPRKCRNAATSSGNMEYGVADAFVMRIGVEPARFGYVADGSAAPIALILMGNRRPLRMLR